MNVPSLKSSIRLWSLILILAGASAPTLAAQTLRPFTALRVIQTEHFDIIFPEASRRSAETLASFADAEYGRVSSLLGIEFKGRIPVTITPATDEFNGYCAPLPYTHIVLYDTPMSIEWTAFDDTLEKLFRHELTHAVSLSTRSPLMETLRGIFGGWVYPAMLNVPAFMTEGVTVSFESLDGFGRANDPLVKEKLRQALRERKFLSPFQAAGAYDESHIASGAYEYGGLFSAYIQRRWGMDKYARLWKAMGSELRLSLDYDRHGFYKLFSEVYGLDFEKAWADFADSLVLTGLEENEGEAILAGEIRLGPLDSSGGRVFAYEALSRQVLAIDPERRKVTGRFTPAESVASLDVSEDGKRILVAGYRYEGELASAAASEYDALTGRPTGRAWKGLFEPRYFREGVVALASDLHVNKIVYRGDDGVQRTLLEGRDDLVFSTPEPVDSNRIAFIVAIRGLRRLGLYDFRTGRASLATTSLPDDAERWRYMRDLQASGGRLFFSYDHDDRMYKLGVVNLDFGEAANVIFEERDFSGGVHAMAELGGRVFYRAAFADSDALLRYPTTLADLAGSKAPLAFEEWHEGDPKPPLPSVREGATTRERGYSPLPYLNPFRYWIPLPLTVTTGDEPQINGLGIASYMTDPFDLNSINLAIGADWRHMMAYFDLSWTSLGLGLPISLQASDSIEYASGEAYRASRLSASLSLARGLGGESLYLSLNPQLSLALFAQDPADGSSAYSWSYEAPFVIAGGKIGLSTMRQYKWELFPQGYSLTALGLTSFGSTSARFEGLAKGGLKLFFPFRASLYGAWDENGIGIDGASPVYGEALFSAMASTEYAKESPTRLSWLAGGSVDAELLDISTQTNLSHLYVNRLFGTLGWRGVTYDAGSADSSYAGSPLWGNVRLAQSILARAGAVITLAPAAMLSIKLTPNVWVAWKLSDLLDDDPQNDLSYGFSLTMDW